MENSDWYSPNLSTSDAGGDVGSGGGNAPNTTQSSPGGDIVSTSSMQNCSLPSPVLISDQDYNVVTATICGLYLIFGVVCTFFGYRCFKVRKISRGKRMGKTVNRSTSFRWVRLNRFSKVLKLG